MFNFGLYLDFKNKFSNINKMTHAKWTSIGKIEILKSKSLQEITVDKIKIALTYKNENFAAVSGLCNHAGGPLGQGRLDGDYIVCPWHNWKFHSQTGQGEPGFEKDCVPRYNLKTEAGEVFIDLDSASPRGKLPHPKHTLAREVSKQTGPLRVVGISTTNMDEANPRTSTSDFLLEAALLHAKNNANTDTQLIRLSALQFKACEGYYSKSAKACTWPCSITQMDSKDEMDQVYEAIVHWADVIIIATPIRWGNASSLYYKMVERLNCVQNQITINNKELIKNKTVGMIITGGQDNIQSVAGQLLGFFSEIGCVFPPFPYIAHSRGWTSEDMEKNVSQVLHSKELKTAAEELVERALHTAQILRDQPDKKFESRAGRKAHELKE